MGYTYQQSNLRALNPMHRLFGGLQNRSFFGVATKSIIAKNQAKSAATPPSIVLALFDYSNKKKN